MSRKKQTKRYDQNIIEALKKLPSPIYDRKHNIYIYANDNRARSNETRFEHIAKQYHELKVRDIEVIPDGINRYCYFSKSKNIKDTYYYYIVRKGEDKGFIRVAIQLNSQNRKAYIKTIYVLYRIKEK